VRGAGTAPFRGGRGPIGIGRRAVADQILQPQHFVRLVKFEQLLISLSRILCRLFGRGIERGGVFRHNPAGGAGLFADGLEGELGEPVAHREPHRPPLEPLEPLEDRRIDEIANTQVSLGHRSTAFEIGQFAPDRVIDRIEVVLDQAEEKLAPPRLRRIPRGREWGANPAPAGGTLELRLVLEARHMPVDAVAQVGKGLAQGRLDLEPLFLRRDHA
jgi:hypothetical protein